MAAFWRTLWSDSAPIALIDARQRPYARRPRRRVVVRRRDDPAAIADPFAGVGVAQFVGLAGLLILVGAVAGHDVVDAGEVLVRGVELRDHTPLVALRLAAPLRRRIVR